MEPTLRQALDQATEARTTGRLEDAERLYRIVLGKQPTHPEACYMLGTLYVSMGRINEALFVLEMAIESDPKRTECWVSYIDALLAAGRVQQARDTIQRARRSNVRQDALGKFLDRMVTAPGQADLVPLVGALRSSDYGELERRAIDLTRNFPFSPIGWKSRGVATFKMNRLDEALNQLKRAATLDPADAEIHNYLGHVQRAKGSLENAEACYRTAIAAQPNLAGPYNALGTLLVGSRRFAEAASCLRQAIGLKPNFAAAYTNLGIALDHLGDHSEARGCFLSAILHAPHDPSTHYNLGNFLKGQDDLEGAVASYRRAIDQDPDHVHALINLGEVLKDLGEFDEASKNCDRAVAKAPESPRAHWNRSIQNLRAGNFSAGWSEYEWRWKYDEFPTARRDFSRPLWLGDRPLQGKRILVHWEQGFGDTIQFSRYISLFGSTGGTVLFAPQPSLRTLMKSLIGRFRLVDLGDRELEFDYHVPLLSLPLAFGTGPDSIPANVPYLSAEEDRLRYWRTRVGESGFKVGICWQGSAGSLDRDRSFPVSSFFGISQLPTIRLISLHKGEGLSQLERLPAGMRVESFASELDTGDASFVDTAALASICDVVITSDTAIAHLGGALGIRTWVALKSVADWRWLVDRSDSPWYPSVKLFRQRVRGDWSSVFSDIEGHVKALLR